MHIHAYTCIYMHIHAYTCIYIHIRAYTYIYKHIHTYTYIRAYTCTYKHHQIAVWRCFQGVAADAPRLLGGGHETGTNQSSPPISTRSGTAHSLPNCANASKRSLLPGTAIPPGPNTLTRISTTNWRCKRPGTQWSNRFTKIQE